MNRLLVLKQIDLFGHLSLDEIALLAEAMEFETRIAGESIITEGDPARELFIVTEGTVTILKGPEKREIATVGAGECFGEMGLFDDSLRSASAVCREDCALLKLEKNRFVSLARQRPEISLQMCRVLSQRIRATNEHVVS
jgi:CRP-like cAMP-binding protein